jgi:hypothetical protein
MILLAVFKTLRWKTLQPSWFTLFHLNADLYFHIVLAAGIYFCRVFVLLKMIVGFYCFFYSLFWVLPIVSQSSKIWLIYFLNLNDFSTCKMKIWNTMWKLHINSYLLLSFRKQSKLNNNVCKCTSKPYSRNTNNMYRYVKLSVLSALDLNSSMQAEKSFKYLLS